jgi:hypothetical protein
LDADEALERGGVFEPCRGGGGTGEGTGEMVPGEQLMDPKTVKKLEKELKDSGGYHIIRR